MATTGGNTATGNESFNYNGDGFPPRAPRSSSRTRSTCRSSPAWSATRPRRPTRPTARPASTPATPPPQGNRSASDVDQTATGDVQGRAPSPRRSPASSTPASAPPTAVATRRSATGPTTTSRCWQTHRGALPLFGLSAFQASASNASDGDAWITTGDAWALGNDSTTDVSQESVAKGDVFNVLPQVSGVQNVGLASATTGDNDGQRQLGGQHAPGCRPDHRDTLGGSTARPGRAQQRRLGRQLVRRHRLRSPRATPRPRATVVHRPQPGDRPDRARDPVPGRRRGQRRRGRRQHRRKRGHREQQLQLRRHRPDPSPSATGEEPVTIDRRRRRSNSADLSATTDGSADITTGDATASGNESTTAAVADLRRRHRRRWPRAQHPGRAGGQRGRRRRRHRRQRGHRERLVLRPQRHHPNARPSSSVEIGVENGSAPVIDTTIAALGIVGSNTIRPATPPTAARRSPPATRRPPATAATPRSARPRTGRSTGSASPSTPRRRSSSTSGRPVPSPAATTRVGQPLRQPGPARARPPTIGSDNAGPATTIAAPQIIASNSGHRREQLRRLRQHRHGRRRGHRQRVLDAPRPGDRRRASPASGFVARHPGRPWSPTSAWPAPTPGFNFATGNDSNNVTASSLPPTAVIGSGNSPTPTR